MADAKVSFDDTTKPPKAPALTVSSTPAQAPALAGRGFSIARNIPPAAATYTIRKEGTLMASEKAERLRLALAEHRAAQEDYDNAERALSLATTRLEMTRRAVAQATDAIKDEGAD